jgi:hypothetical protein
VKAQRNKKRTRNPKVNKGTKGKSRQVKNNRRRPGGKESTNTKNAALDTCKQTKI